MLKKSKRRYLVSRKVTLDVIVETPPMESREDALKWEEREEIDFSLKTTRHYPSVLLEPESVWVKKIHVNDPDYDEIPTVCILEV